MGLMPIQHLGPMKLEAQLGDFPASKKVKTDVASDEEKEEMKGCRLEVSGSGNPFFMAIHGNSLVFRANHPNLSPTSRV